jgi:LysM repeat protein
MFLKRSLIILSIILVVAMLGACVRSASTPPVSVVTPPTEQSSKGAAQEPSAEASKGQPVTTNEVLQQLELFVTQTAAAAQIASGQPAGGQQPGGEVQAGTPYPLVESQATSVEGAASEQVQPGSATQAPGGQEPTAQQPGGQQPTVQQPGGQEPTAQQPGGQQPTAQQPGGQTTVPQPTPQPAPTQPGQIVMPTSTPGIPTSYTLQPGEFVYCIARRFNVNPFELLSINGLSTSSVVRGGTTLKIPQTGHPFPGERSLAAHPTTYIVKGGENIYEVSCTFGNVSPDQIAYANNLQPPYTLTAGQNLVIP